jgi:hypothetical protein
VVEKAPGNELGSRNLYLLMQGANGRYIVKHANQNIIKGKQEGGVWGDPFQNIEISNNTLIVNEYGGSNFRWAFCDKYQYIADEFMLISSQVDNYYMGTGYGYNAEYDYANGVVIYKSYSRIKNYQPKLIFSGNLTSKYSFDTYDMRKQKHVDGFNFLPSLGYYDYNKYDKMFELKITTNKALELVRNTIKPDMEKVQIPWTAETKANYSSLTFYIVPDLYYRKGNSTLYYYKLVNKEGKLEHSIIFRDGNDNYKFYSVDDLTGEVKK